MKLLLSLVAIAGIMFPATTISAQSAGLEFAYGTATYEMSELHDFTDAYIRSNPSYKLTKDLPSGNYFRAAFVVGIGKVEAGVEFQQHQTESRMDGEENGIPVYYSHKLDGFAFGLFAKYPFYYSKRFQAKAGLTATLFATVANITNTATTGSDVTNEYQAASPGVIPFVEPVFYIRKWVYIGVRASYAYDFDAALYTRDTNDIKYVDDNGDVIKMNWSGFRADAFIGFRMNSD
jgi:hypothetical protein